jgi:hypothetical protein
MRSRAAAQHPFAPNPPNHTASLTLAQGDRRLTFRWRTDDDDNLPSDPAD